MTRITPIGKGLSQSTVQHINASLPSQICPVRHVARNTLQETVLTQGQTAGGNRIKRVCENK